MIDEKDDLYEKVAQELKRGEEHSGLMARATAEANGNPEKRRSLYIRYRVAELSEARQHSADKMVREQPANTRATGTLEATQVEEIQALLAKPLTIDSCEKILIMLGMRLIRQETGTWAIEARTGSKRFLYSFDELKKYTETSAVVALTTPGIGLVQEVKSSPSPVGLHAEQASQLKPSKPPHYGQQTSGRNPRRQMEQPASEQQRSDSSKLNFNSTFVPQKAQSQDRSIIVSCAILLGIFILEIAQVRLFHSMPYVLDYVFRALGAFLAIIVIPLLIATVAKFAKKGFWDALWKSLAFIAIPLSLLSFYGAYIE